MGPHVATAPLIIRGEEKNCERPYVTSSMKQSPCLKAYSFSAGQELPRILRNADVLLHVHKIRLPVPNQEQISPVQAILTDF